MLNRVHQAFLDAGLSEHTLHFAFSDAPFPGQASSVDRVLKRQPEMAQSVETDSPMIGFPDTRRLTGAVSVEAASFSSIQAIATGVPRSFPFHSVTLHFHAPAFGDMEIGGPQVGVTLTDCWWINGRNRSLSAMTVVDADPRSKKLPIVTESVASVLASFGKAKRVWQVPLTPAEAQPQASTASASLEAAAAVQAIAVDYRSRLKEIVERAALPHDLPPPSEVPQQFLGLVSGPMKPTLVELFKPMGYTCHGATGTFTLRRKTQANLTAQLYLDVGTWSRRVLAIFQVLGVGFKANVSIPVTARALGSMQYPIGDAEHWRKIAENLAALVAELDRTLVPEIEQAAGPTPEWFEPES